MDSAGTTTNVFSALPASIAAWVPGWVPGWALPFVSAGTLIVFVAIILRVGYEVLWRLVVSRIPGLRNFILDLTGSGENAERKRLARENRERERQERASHISKQLAIAKALKERARHRAFTTSESY